MRVKGKISNTFSLNTPHEIVAGFLLLINKWKGFALILGTIISVNIVLFHIALDISGIGLAVVVAILNTVLMYDNCSKFKTLF